MPYKIIAQPSCEPLTLQEAKDHLRVDATYTDSDNLISAHIMAARRWAERFMSRALVTQRWKYIGDSFPGPSQIGIPYGTLYSNPRHAILLERSPVQSVDAITYIDTGGVQQAMLASDYVVDLVSEPCRITPVFGKIWPITLPQIGSVEVDFTCGYGAFNTATPPAWVGEPIPEDIKSALKLYVEALYDPSFNDKGNLEFERKVKAAENILSAATVMM